jgi:hypothetical protein
LKQKILRVRKNQLSCSVKVGGSTPWRTLHRFASREHVAQQPDRNLPVVTVFQFIRNGSDEPEQDIYRSLAATISNAACGSTHVRLHIADSHSRRYTRRKVRKSPLVSRIPAACRLKRTDRTAC